MLATAQAPAPISAPSPASVDARRLEASEELSESLANDLLELSVATKNLDLEKTTQWFPDRFRGQPFPSEPSTLKPSVKWVASHSWIAKAASADAQITSSVFLNGWSTFLDHFSEIEGWVFKVKVANLDAWAQAVIGAAVPTAIPGARGHARVAFFVIGRAHENRREWARGVIEADFRYADN